MDTKPGPAPEATPSTVPYATTMAPTAPPEASGARRPSVHKSSARILYDALGHVNPRSFDPRVQRRRQLFAISPAERELKVNRNGRQLSELEILQEKHESEFRLIVPIVADVLTACVEHHTELSKTAPRDTRYTHYETNAVPGIQIEDYVHRLAEYTYISPATLVAALVFLDRMCVRHTTLLITNLNVFKLFFVAVRVASKVVELRTLNNKNFASVGGISNRHLNELEAKFLIDMRFDLYVQPREFYLYAQKVAAAVPGAYAPQSIPRPVVRDVQEQEAVARHS